MSAYSLLVGLGASLALLRVVQNVPRWQSSRWANAGLWALLGALLGARILYVLLHGSYYTSHLFQAFALWMGGLSWPGAVLGGIVAVLILSSRWGIAVSKIADGLVPMIPPLVVSIWLGCWWAGFSYGAPASEGAFWGVPGKDEFGRIEPRFPLQILAAVSMLIYAFLLEIRKPLLKENGQMAALMLLGLGLNVLVFMPLRADPAPIWLGLRLDTWAAMGLFAISLAGVFWTFFHSRESQQAELDQDRI